jgi:ribonuclease HI
MPWMEATLRGQKVFARVKADRSLDVEAGRVEIRYKAKDPRAYRASPGNLTIAKDAPLLPDDACVPGQPIAPKDDALREAGAKVSVSLAAYAQWVAYTDGACTGNPGPAGAGMVLIVPGGTVHEGYEYLGTATNNVGELTAILRALEAIPKTAETIAIHTDSKYAIGVLTQNWKLKANQALIGQTKAVLAGRKVRFVYVPGHSGVPMNERADELAREAIRERRSRPLPTLAP